MSGEVPSLPKRLTMNHNAGFFGPGSDANGGETPEFKTLLDASMEELRLKTMGHQAGWGFGKAARWSLDQSRGDLLFTFDDGVVATCPAQIIGSFDAADGSGCGPGPTHLLPIP